jgi:very-short-patch-repair endonuclease
MTGFEVRLWSALRAQRQNFRRQTPIGPFIVDFSHHGSKLVVELDGGHHAEADALERDRARTDWLNARGYEVLRFWNADVIDNLDGVVETILLAVSRRSSPPRPSPVQGEGE